MGQERNRPINIPDVVGGESQIAGGGASSRKQTTDPGGEEERHATVTRPCGLPVEQVGEHAEDFGVTDAFGRPSDSREEDPIEPSSGRKPPRDPRLAVVEQGDLEPSFLDDRMPGEEGPPKNKRLAAAAKPETAEVRLWIHGSVVASRADVHQPYRRRRNARIEPGVERQQECVNVGWFRRAAIEGLSASQEVPTRECEGGRALERGPWDVRVEAVHRNHRSWLDLLAGPDRAVVRG